MKRPEFPNKWEALRLLYRGNQGKNLMPMTRLEYAIRAYGDIFEVVEPFDFAAAIVHDCDRTFWGIATLLDQRVEEENARLSATNARED